MDSLAASIHSSNSHHSHAQQQHQQQVQCGGDDEFDEIVPMQLDQPPGPTAGFFANGQQVQQQQQTAGGQQNYFPTCAPPVQAHHQTLQQHSPLAQIQHQTQRQHQHFGRPQLLMGQSQQMADQQQFNQHGTGQHPFGHPQFGHPQQRAWPPPQQTQFNGHHQQQQQHWQMPLRKESMPALHFNDQPYQQQPPPTMPPAYGAQEQNRFTERTRSMSTAMLFCAPSPSSTGQQFAHNLGGHSPGGSMGGGQQMVQDYRRTKSTVLPPTGPSGSWRPSSSASVVHSLRRFHSQLRSPCRYSSTLLGAAPPGHLPPLKPYTPPPILSPMRQGSGLFNRILAHKERKQSSLATFSIGPNNNNNSVTFEDELLDKPEINGCNDIEEMAADEEENNNNNGHVHLQNGTLQNGLVDGIVKENDGNEHAEPGERPQRKNGTILFAADGPSGSGLSFAAELEQLRKASSSSYRSHKASMFGGRMSIRHGKLSVANDDFVRKMSTVSMEEQQEQQQTMAEDGADKPPESDSIPHINLGKNYQARVKKWADRAISAQERAAIPDRDEPIFSAQSIEHIPQEALAAFETLACSVALPKLGRNKELALHILAENQGNLQAAVMDLLRCDTLDWEQYPAVYNSRYVDVDAWSPEEINSFQDAIYKSEKDFQQVAAELGNRTVHECVAFYYTWKKACPDDYRKLRNLRRKRQLLEQQLDLTSFDQRQPSQSEKSCKEGASSEDDEEEEDFSETESDITNPSLLGPLQQQPMDCSPGQRKHSQAALSGTTVPSMDPLASLLAPSALHTQQNSQPLFNGNGHAGTTNGGGGYPWLHGTDGIFPSPTSSSTSTNNNDSSANSSSIGALFSQLSQESHPELGENGNSHGNSVFAPKIRHHHHHGHSAKKGAQPQADGFFHCRLCEKRFEKVKSLNAHMKSHAMKARAEAEAQQKQQQHLVFPVPTKKEPLSAETATNPLAGLASTALGMPGLPSHAQAAMAALNNIGRQIQQQQSGQQPFGGIGANPGFGLLRNMLQYGQQQAGAQTGTTTTGWPGLEQHFNA